MDVLHPSKAGFIQVSARMTVIVVIGEKTVRMASICLSETLKYLSTLRVKVKDVHGSLSVHLGLFASYDLATSHCFTLIIINFSKCRTLFEKTNHLRLQMVRSLGASDAKQIRR